MAAIILPERRRRQPTRPVDLDSYWRSRNPVLLVVPSLGRINLVGEHQVGSNGAGGGPEYGVGRGGIGYTSSTTNQGLAFLDYAFGGTSPITCIGYADTFGASTRGALISQGSEVVLRNNTAYTGTEFILNTFSTNDRTDVVGSANPIGAFLAGTYGPSGKLRAYANRAYAEVAPTGTYADSAVLFTVGYGPSLGYWNNPYYLAGVFSSELSEAEIFALVENPWQIFRPRNHVLYFGGGGAAVNLDGSISGTATAAGALSLSVPIAGAAVSQATASGALSQTIPLAGTATGTATSAGALSLTIPLAASAIAEAIAAASLAKTSTLAASVSGSASAADDLSLSVTLSGAALASAVTAAALDVSSAGTADLAASISGAASTAGALSLSVPLAGAALTASSADGSLTHIVPLAAAAASASSATGGLDITVTLSGAALASALAQAGLDVSGGLSASITGTAAASAGLDLRINLAASAIAQAVAAGALTAQGQILAARPGFTRTAAARVVRAAANARDYRIAA